MTDEIDTRWWTEGVLRTDQDVRGPVDIEAPEVVPKQEMPDEPPL